VAVAQIDLSSPEREIRLQARSDGTPYTAVALLVRDDHRPVSWMLCDTPAGGVLSVDELPLPERAGGQASPPASAPTTSISVVITTCASAESTVNCVRSVLGSAHPPTEVIVVDNRPEGSPVAAALLAAFQQPQAPVRYVPEPRQGLSIARNAGLAQATSELVAFADDDVTVDRCWLTAMRRAFENDPGLSCVTGLILPLELENAAQLEFEHFTSLGKGLVPRRYSTSERPPGMPLFPYAAGHLGSGANATFRRLDLKELGGFDPMLGAGTRTQGGEDLDIFIRLLTNGGNLAYEPSAIVWHRHPADRAAVRRRALSYGIGFGAVTGKLLMSSQHRAAIVRLAPAALAYWFRPQSRKNVARDHGTTSRRDQITETVGVVFGPFSYLRSRLTRPAADQPKVAVAETEQPRAFTPIWSGQLELSEPALPDRLIQADGQPFQRARLLIRAAGTPVGFVEIDTPDGVPSLEQALGEARQMFGADAARQSADTQWQSADGPKVSVVLCTHNRPTGVRRTLKSFQELHYKNLEILVVDNAPTDEETAAVVSEFAANDPRIRYVREPAKGLSRARNRGLAEVTGELIAFTDDDVRVDRLWVDGLLRGFNRRSDVACITGLVASTSLEHPAEQYFDRRVWWSSSCEHRIHTGKREPGDSALHPYTSGTFGTGANFACRVDVLRELGGFDQCLGAGSPTRGGEDLDIFVRLLRGGHALSYEPSALVWHDHRVDDASLRSQMYAYGLGLTAYMTKYLLAPSSRWDVGRLTLRGLWYTLLLFRRSQRAEAEADMGDGLSTAELRGMAAGPAAYIGARRHETREHLAAVAP